MKHPPAHAPGHYYSPVNDPDTLDAKLLAARRMTLEPNDLPELRLDLSKFRLLWRSFSEFQQRFPFPEERSKTFRYYMNNPVYGVGDALVLHSMLAALRPRQVIEIGSGFSSACMLDTADQFAIKTEFTFIEPSSARLKSLLTPDDLLTCRILELPVQQISLELFDQLRDGDLLFIDSTHVMKSCSDVNFALFELLPRLRRGVVVHFHDIFWPFEYPVGWIFDRGYSWNEIYGLRAFLAYNNAFDIIFFNDLFFLQCRDTIEETSLPEVARGAKLHMGGGMWLRKMV